MQTWAKRGIQTVLVTGGVMMLGTGIAAADDTIDPDAPPSALDATVKVPVRIDRNAIGTPMGARHLPSVQRDITVAPGKAVRKVPAGRAHELTDDEDLLKDNQAVGTVVMPAKATGNAVALGGDVSVADTSSQHVAHHQDVHADGSDETLAGNVVRLAYSLPIDVSGNAVAVVDDAAVVSSSQQSGVAEGDVTTNGDDGVMSGNVVAAHGATPVQATGNAVSAAGTASTASSADSAASAGGPIKTSGADSLASGDAGGVPVAVPVRVSGNSVTKLGIAESLSSANSSAHAGDEAPDLFGVPTYIQTNGKDGATASGNGVHTPVAGPVTVDCNSVGDVGNSASLCQTGSDTSAGGGTRTFGDNSVVSGMVGTTPVAMPVQGQSNCGTLVGNCDTGGTNHTASEAGGDSYTRGHDSIVGGTSATVPVAGPVDLCGNAAGVGGLAAALCSNTSTTEAGGNTGTTGDDSVFGGNNGSVPVAFPVEGLGNVAGVAGDAESIVKEHKVSTAGGGNNTNDEAAIGGANLVTVPVAGPLQAFGNGAGAGGNTQSQLDGHSTVTAGGPSRAKGTLGTLSGNIAQAPLAAPTQVFGSGAALVGNGKHVAANDTTSTSGGHAVTDGTDGNISGNLVTAPVATALQGFGVAGAVVGDEEAVGANVTEMTAGGNGSTSGADGNIAGNIVSPQALPVVQAFGDGIAAVAADARGVGANSTEGHAGGDLTTSGEGGHLAGNLLDVPAAALLQAHGNAVAAAAADAVGASNNVTTGSAGGATHTDGDTSDLSGNDSQLPIELDLPIYGVPIEVLADAIADAKHYSDVSVGEEEPVGVDLPRAGTMEATKLPPLPNLSALPYPGGHGMSRFDRPAPADPLSALLGGGLGNPLGELSKLFTLGGGGTSRTDHTRAGDPLTDLLGGSPVGALLGGQSPLSGLVGQDPLGGLGEVAGLGGLAGGTGLPLADGRMPGTVTAEVQNPLADSVRVDGVTGVAEGLVGVAGGAGRADLPTGGNPLEGVTDQLGGLGDVTGVVGDLFGAAGGAGRADLPTGGNPLEGVTDQLGGLGDVTGVAGDLFGAAGGAGRADLPTGGNPLDGLTGGLTGPLGGLAGAGRTDVPTGDIPLDGLTGGVGDPLANLAGLGGATGRSDLPLGDNPLQGVSGQVQNPLTDSRGLLGLEDVAAPQRSDVPLVGNPLGGLIGGQQNPLAGLGGVTGGVGETDNPLGAALAGASALHQVLGLAGASGFPGRTDLPTGDNPLDAVTSGLDGLAGLGGQTGAPRSGLPLGGSPIDGVNTEVTNPLTDVSELIGLEEMGDGGAEIPPTGAALESVLGAAGSQSPLGDLGDLLGLGGLAGGGRADLPTGDNPLDGLTGGLGSPLGELAGVGGGATGRTDHLPQTPDPLGALLGGDTGIETPLGDLGDLLGLGAVGDAGEAGLPLAASSLAGLTGGQNPLAGLGGGTGRADLPTPKNPLDGPLDGVTDDLGNPLEQIDDLVDPNGLTAGRHPVSDTFPQAAGLVRPVESGVDLFDALNSVTEVGGVSGAARHHRPAHGPLGALPTGRAEDPQPYLDPQQQYPDSLSSGIDYAFEHMTGNGVDLQHTPVGGLTALTSPAPRSGNPMSTLLGGVLTSTTMGVMRNPLEGSESLDGMTVGQRPLSDMTLVLPRIDEPMTDVLYFVGSPESPLDDYTKGLRLGDLNGKQTHGVNGLSNPTAGLTDPLADTAVLPTPRFAAPTMPGLDGAPGLDNLEGAFSGNLVQTPSLDRSPVQTPALSGLDARTALPAAHGTSLADTQSRLTDLVGRNPIG